MIQKIRFSGVRPSGRTVLFGGKPTSRNLDPCLSHMSGRPCVNIIMMFASAGVTTEYGSEIAELLCAAGCNVNMLVRFL